MAFSLLHAICSFGLAVLPKLWVYSSGQDSLDQHECGAKLEMLPPERDTHHFHSTSLAKASHMTGSQGPPTPSAEAEKHMLAVPTTSRRTSEIVLEAEERERHTCASLLSHPFTSGCALLPVQGTSSHLPLLLSLLSRSCPRDALGNCIEPLALEFTPLICPDQHLSKLLSVQG